MEQHHDRPKLCNNVSSIDEIQSIHHKPYYIIVAMYIECLYAVYALLVERATRVRIRDAATEKL